MSPIGSYVGGLTSKGQVGVLLGEHRGWILRMATLIKGRLSDNRPEACGASFQTSERTSACFPLIKECSISPPAKREALHSLEPKACRLMSLCSYRPAKPRRIRTDSKHSLRLFDMSFLLVTRLLNSRICLFRTDSSQYRFATFLYPQAYEQSESALSNSKPLTSCLPLYRGKGSRLRPG